MAAIPSAPAWREYSRRLVPGCRPVVHAIGRYAVREDRCTGRWVVACEGGSSEERSGMSYAGDKLCYDSDSHLMETTDWLHSFATAEEAPLIAELNPGNAGRGVREAIDRAKTRRESEEATAKLLEQPIISGPKGWFAFGASTPEERSRALDLLGFKRQLIF